MSARVKGDAYHAAKLLHGKLARIAERRDREHARSNANFQIDVLATIGDAPPTIVRWVLDALGSDPEQEHLRRALQEAIDVHADASSRGGLVGDIASELVAAAAEDDRPTESPPPPAGVSDERPQTARSAIPSVPVLMPRVEEYPSSPPAARYPEPGEPAITLPDGTVVAVEPDPWELGGDLRNESRVPSKARRGS